MTPTPRPYDGDLPSPIADVMSMLSSAAESVVVAGQLTAQQRRVAIPTGLEHRILERVAAGGLDLVVISGSAGDGKSFTLGSILAMPGNPWESFPERVIEDATHSERPEQAQSDRLKEFFAPLRGGQPRLDGPPLIIAMNTGMVIRFFNALRADAGQFEPYRDLAATLFHALRIPDKEAGTPDPAFASKVLVVNLDERPTTGGEDSFFAGVLRAFDPASGDGVMGGAPRCATCVVREWCWVRSNAEIISSEPTRGVLDALADEIALVRGRSINPRALWDAAAAIALGGATFVADDPCKEIAGTAASEDWSRVWDHSLPNGVFHVSRGVGGVAAALRERDPSFLADSRTHAAIADAGIDEAQDAANLTAAIGAADGSRLAVTKLARGLASGELAAALGEKRARREIARGLARASWLSGASTGADRNLRMFQEALAQYAIDDGGNALYDIEDLVGEALSRSFGELMGGEHFFRVGRQDARDVAVYVKVQLAPGRSHEVPPDPVVETNPRGAELVGYRPLTLPLRISGVDVTLTYGLFRVLQEASSGRLPSATELERFYSLGRAVTALGNQAGQDRSRPILIVDGRESGRRVRIEVQDRRGSRRFRAQEIL